MKLNLGERDSLSQFLLWLRSHSAQHSSGKVASPSSTLWTFEEMTRLPSSKTQRPRLWPISLWSRKQATSVPVLETLIPGHCSSPWSSNLASFGYKGIDVSDLNGFSQLHPNELLEESHPVFPGRLHEHPAHYKMLHELALLNDTDAAVRELAKWEPFPSGNLQSPSLIQPRVPHNGTQWQRWRLFLLKEALPET